MIERPKWEKTFNLRHYVDNRIPSQTTSVLQQEWISSEGLIKWVDLPVVFSNPTPIRDTKS